MKYGFNFNQKAVVDAGLHDKTDISDWFILSYIKEWGDSELGIKLDGRTWINYQHALDELPMLGFKTKAAFSYRIKKLEQIGLISTYFEAESNRLFAITTVFYSRILYGVGHKNSVNSAERPLNEFNDSVKSAERGVKSAERGVKSAERIIKPVLLNQEYLTNEPASASDEKKNSLLSQVEGWYRQQGYQEKIEDHLAFFVDKLATHRSIPTNLAGYFKRVIEEDWAGLRKPPAPDWATLPPPGSDLVRFIVQHGFPNRLRHLDTEEQCRFELKKLIAARLVEQKLNAA